jgi:hypothetical protein
MHRQHQGIALVSTILIMAILLILAFTFSFVTITERRAASSSITINTGVQSADAVSERARVMLIEAYEDTRFGTRNFLQTLSAVASGQATPPNPAFDPFVGVSTTTVNEVAVNWQIRDVVLYNNDASGYVDVAATATLPNSGRQTVLRRVNFGVSPIFELAMLAERVDCMFCHLRVNGDVGTLDFFRPGWGTEGVRGIGSGNERGGSTINGELFAARGVTEDAASNICDGDDKDGSPSRANGALITRGACKNSRSSKLPRDTNNDGVANFPPIERAVRSSADGTLSGGTMFGVGLNSTFASRTPVSSINGVYEGNLIIDGTNSPINLARDIFVDGDVIIKGEVTGIGTIYSARNIYIAGDVTLKNPPDAPGQGVCSGITDPDACADANIVAGKDALRFGARGSIIVGDYTEYEADGSLSPFNKRQSADFYREQFGFEINRGTHCYDRATGDELRQDRNDPTVHRNAEGDIVTNKVCISDDAYSHSFRPGRVNSDGSFTSWISDAEYAAILGEESFTRNTLRWAWDSTISNAALAAEIQAALDDITGGTLPSNLGATIASQRVNGRYFELGNGNRAHWQISGGRLTLRLMMAGDYTYETQVNRVDAFLYANQRVAGKTSMQAMRVNGGIIGRDVGILAPGRYLGWPWSGGRQDNCQTAGTRYHVEGTQDCALTINYDYRMRNGGYSYNLVRADVGQTLLWRLAEDEADHVRP